MFILFEVFEDESEMRAFELAFEDVVNVTLKFFEGGGVLNVCFD